MNKKTITFIIILVYLFLPIRVLAGCNMYASKGKDECIKQSDEGYKCTWDGTKKGGSRCYKSKNLIEEKKEELTSCTQVKTHDDCTIINGKQCIWRQNACFNAGTINSSGDDQNNNQNNNQNDDDIMHKVNEQLDKVKNDPTDTNKNLFYNDVKEAISYCHKIYADTTKNSGNKEYDDCVNLENNLNDWVTAGYLSNGVITGSVGTDCDAVLGSLGVWLTKIYKILLLAVPVIIVAFGFKDFIKALTTGKEDELKKAGTIFIKRLIFGAVFVALPIIVKVILTLALGGDLANICIL